MITSCYLQTFNLHRDGSRTTRREYCLNFLKNPMKLKKIWSVSFKVKSERPTFSVTVARLASNSCAKMNDVSVQETRVSVCLEAPLKKQF